MNDRVSFIIAWPYSGERMRARAINKRRVPVKVAIKGLWWRRNGRVHAF